MKLLDYRNLICYLPVRDQSFISKSKTWKPKGEWIDESFSKIFGDCSEIEITRNDLFDLGLNDSEFLAKILIWGYPRGGRGTNIEKILKSDLVQKIHLLRKEKNISTKDIDEILKLKNHLGLSTLSKILYFSDVKIEQCQTVVLDRKIIEILKKGKFEELVGLNKRNKINAQYYLEYIRKLEIIAKSMSTKPENIEQFLFLFGGNLKP